MTVYIGGQKTDANTALDKEKNLLCFSRHGRRSDALEALGFDGGIPPGHPATYFESHAAYDFISLSIPQLKRAAHTHSRLEIYFAPKRLLFVYESAAALQPLRERLDAHTLDGNRLELVLHSFFSGLMERDAERLTAIEDEITSLEDAITEDRRGSYIREISELRRRLLHLKRYHESLVTLLEDLEENQGGLLTEESLRLFHFLSNRADRLVHSVLNLRDYVTQVRESYQAQLDIGLNQTMKLFTVITAIFLPLTLVTGWYGMNVQMPEYGFPYSYVLIIAFSVLVVIALVLYFKKHKWF